MKSNQTAENLRNQGNLFYKDRNFHEALVKYNESLCYGESNSEHLGIAYANRSAVCLEMKKFQKCLTNIKLAKENNYPKENWEILENREKKCREMWKKSKKNDCQKIFKLSHKPSKSIPYIIDDLEMQQNEEFGRHIIARKNLNVGDIITIERPFCSVLLSHSNFVEVDSNNKYFRCAYCLKTNGYELVPCRNCCFAMFCESCYDKAFVQFHKYECPVIQKLLMSGSVHIALRIFFISLSAFDGSIKELKNFMERIDEMDKNYSIFDIDVKENSIENTKRYLRYLNTLARSSNKHSTMQHEEILESHPQLNELYHENIEFIKQFIQRQCQTNDHYFHGIFGQKIKPSDSPTYADLQQSIATGWYPFCSLINHSCASNLMRIYVAGKIVLVVSRFISSGSQLFDCYKVSFAKQPKEERQLKLMKQFNFLCGCEACRNNYPKPPELQAKNSNLLRIARKMETDTFSMQYVNQKIFQECCKLMNTNHDSFPSLEMIWLQKSFAYMLLLKARDESEA